MKKKLSLILAFGALALATSCSDDSESCNGAGFVCHGNVSHVCVNGHLAIYKDCTSLNMVCKADSGECAPGAAVCSDGDVQCSPDGVPQKCQGGQWANQEACGEGKTCEAGECKAAPPLGCQDDKKQCSDAGVPQLCVEGEWKDQAACGEGEACNEGECEVVASMGCEDGEAQCSDAGVPQLCVEGEWKDQEACGDGEECSGGECKAVSPIEKDCEDGNVQCSDAGVPQLCVEGEWTDQDACEEGEECKEGECKPKAEPACENDARQCSDAGVPQLCVEGVWVDQEACEEGKECGKDVEGNDGVCVDVVNLCAEVTGENCLVNPNTGEAVWVSCIDFTEASRISCKNIKDDETTQMQYRGNACVTPVPTRSIGEVCGCNSDEDCNAGYTCNTDYKLCIINPCYGREDGAQCGEYQGRVYGVVCSDGKVVKEEEEYEVEVCEGETPHCISSNENGVPFMACVECGSDTDCPGYATCNEANECEAKENYDPCVTHTEGDFCMSKDQIVSCDSEEIGAVEKCSGSRDGARCLEETEGKAHCGCLIHADCDEGYECEEGKCVSVR